VRHRLKFRRRVPDSRVGEPGDGLWPLLALGGADHQCRFTFNCGADLPHVILAVSPANNRWTKPWNLGIVKMHGTSSRRGINYGSQTQCPTAYPPLQFGRHLRAIIERHVIRFVETFFCGAQNFGSLTPGRQVFPQLQQHFQNLAKRVVGFRFSAPEPSRLTTWQSALFRHEGSQKKLLQEQLEERKA
jgi:hypothetical protein